MVARSISLAGVILVCSTVVPAQQPPPQDPSQTFRTRVTVVPVDVRVVDRDGKPVADLKQQDFTITEDGVPQKIVHFSFQMLTGVGTVSADAPLPTRKPLGDSVAPQNRRIFLIVLGRGRQVGPVKGVEAAMKFVKERLLPQDQVAILAFNRATDFTGDHKKVLDTLQRYWDKHEWIESRLRQRFSGLGAVYGGPEIPASIQKEIDAIFRAPGALTSRRLDSPSIGDGAQLSADVTKNRDLLMRAEEAAVRIANNVASPFDQSIVDQAGLINMPFDEYVEKSFESSTDLGNLYAGVRYLRYLDGEKHLVFLTPHGMTLPRLENSNSIAAFANDARVAVDIVHTGGMAEPRVAPAQLRSAPGRGGAAQTALGAIRSYSDVMFNQQFSVESSRRISELTGGTTTAFQAGARAFTRLDESTRAQYLLGYSPTNITFDGGYRRISVKVNRKDVRVLYRHGYVGRLESTPLNRKEYLIYSRIAAAANLPRELDDLQLTVEKATPTTWENVPVLAVDVRILPGNVKFTRTAEGHIGKVEALYFCADSKQNLIGEHWHSLDFKLTDENHLKFMREGVGYTIRIPVKGDPRYLKVILYDHTADLVGSVMRDLKSAKAP